MQFKTFFGVIGFSLIGILILTGCQSAEINKEFDSSKEIQIIPLTESRHLLVQGDRVIEEESLYNGLSREGETSVNLIKEAKTSTTLSYVSYGLHLATLTGCIVGVPYTSLTGLCAASIGFGFGFNQFATKADAKKVDATKLHNERVQESNLRQASKISGVITNIVILPGGLQ